MNEVPPYDAGDVLLAIIFLIIMFGVLFWIGPPQSGWNIGGGI